jgi:glycosyltransferase involved in cell wall biosynthesis
MKILFALDTYWTNNNGTSISAQRFAEVLRRHGHEVRILATDERYPDETGLKDDLYLLPEVHVHPFDSLIHKHGFRFAKCKRAIIREAVAWAEVVHCMMPFPLTRAVKREADRQGKPATAAFHIQPENITSNIRLNKIKPVTSFVYELWWQYIYRDFQHIHCPSQFMADQLVKHGYKGQLHPISNGIDPSFHYTKREKDKKWEGKILVIMTGRLANEKRQDLLLHAVGISRYRDQIQLIFAGKGPELHKYEKMGRQLPNTPIFGYYSREELQDLLSQADLYVHTSDMESEAIGCIEGFAMGLVPVISDSSLSATRQFALDERSLFHVGDPNDLASKIDYWLSHTDERKRMEHEYAELASHYQIEESVRKFEAMLQMQIDETNAQKAKSK